MAADLRPRPVLRRPARRWPRWRLALAGLLAVALVAGAVWAVFYSGLLTVRTVDVAGNERLSAAQVRHAAAVPMGQPLARVDLSAVAARVEAIRGVREVTVSTEWPHTVLVRVSERIPVAVLGAASVTEAVDAAGAVFAIRRGEARALPRITVPTRAAAAAVAEAARVVAALPPHLAGRVQRVRAASPDSVTLHLRGGDAVVWGSAHRSTTKARVLGVLLRQPGSVYDVSVPEQPTTSE